MRMKEQSDDKYFRIPKPSKQIISLLKGGLLMVIGSILGVCFMILFYHPKYDNYNAQEWEKIYNDFLSLKCSSDVVDNIVNFSPNHKVKMISVDELLKCEPGIDAYKNYQIDHPMPTPTPVTKVQYINNTPSHPDLSSCTLKGNFYYCPSDNCYYNPNGTKTGVCNIAPPGGF